MKKNGLLFLFITILIALLVGCSSEKTTSNNDGKIEIEFWYGLGGKLGENVENTIKEFNESQDEVKVIGVAQGDYDETLQKLQAGIAAKKVPAVVLLENDPMNNLASKGALASLSSFIEKDEEFRPEEFVTAFYNQGTIDGEQYAIPFYGTTQVMYYRKDIFEELGISPDELNTWEGVAEAAKKIKEEKGIYGWEPMWGPGNLIDAALSRGAKYISEDGKEVLIDSKEWVESWEFFRKAIHEDEIMSIQHGGQGWEYWYKTIDDVMQGRAAGYTGSSGDQGDLDFEIIAAHTQPGWEGHAAAPHAAAQMVAVPAIVSEEEQEAGYKWIKFFTNAENAAEWSMNSGYIAARTTAQDIPAFKEFAETNPQILIPLQQAQKATPPFVDPTGGKIYDALNKAADKVEIEGIPAAEALKEAKQEAQRALDEVSK